jgi:ATP-binding cassette, subfamily B (MDR/TAP), member 1
MAKSRQAAQQLKSLCDREPIIDSWSESGEKLEGMEGKVEFRDVHFSYPSRGVPVLQGVNITAAPGQFVALVGASGCGKSTAIGLIERFYNPVSGGIFVDGKDISKLNIKDYRGHLALVSQEPVLYSGTVKENILLGVKSEDIKDEKVTDACKRANIYEFIVSLPVSPFETF